MKRNEEEDDRMNQENDNRYRKQSIVFHWVTRKEKKGC